MLVHDVTDALRAMWGRSWRWLVWTPRRLLTVFVVVVAGALLWSTTTSGGATAGGGDDGFVADDDLPAGWRGWSQVEAKPSETPAERAGASTGTASAGSEGSPGAHRSPSASVRKEVTTLVTTFSQEYLTANRSAAAWRKAVEPMVTPGLAEALVTVDPKNLPPATVSGPVDVTAIGDMGGITEVETDVGTMIVKVTNTGSQWRVSQVRPPTQQSEG